MRDRHKKPGMGIALRGGGLLLLAGAWLLERALRHFPPAPTPNQLPPVELLLAMFLFICASLGAAFLVLGPHLFDRVRVSDRWARLPVVREMEPMLFETPAEGSESPSTRQKS